MDYNTMSYFLFLCIIPIIHNNQFFKSQLNDLSKTVPEFFLQMHFSTALVLVTHMFLKLLSS